MKTKSILFSVITAVAIFGFASATSIIDVQIEDELNKKEQQEMMKKAQDLNEKITFTKVNSCKSMESVMSGFLETYRQLHPKRNYDHGWYYHDEDLLLEEVSRSDASSMTNSIAVK